MSKIFIAFILVGLVSFSALAQKPLLTMPAAANTKPKTFQITPNGRYILIAYDDKSIKVYDHTSKKLVFTFLGHEKNVREIIIAADNRTVVSADEEGNVILWDLNTGREIRKIIDRLGANIPVRILNMRLSNHDKDLIVSGYGGIICFDISTGKRKFSKKYGKLPVRKVMGSKLGTYILSAMPDTGRKDTLTNMVLANAQTGNEVKRIAVQSAVLVSAVISSNEKFIYYVTNNAFELRKYDIANGNSTVEKTFDAAFEPKDIFELPDEQLLISCKENRRLTFLIYSLKSHQIVHTIKTEDRYLVLFDESIPFYHNANIPHTVFYFHNGINSIDLKLGKLTKHDFGIQKFSKRLVMSEDHLLFVEDNVLKRWDFKKNQVIDLYKSAESIFSIKELEEEILIDSKNKFVVLDKKKLNAVKKEIAVPNTEYILGIYPNEKRKLLTLHLKWTDTLLLYNTKDYTFNKMIKLPGLKEGVRTLKSFGEETFVYKGAADDEAQHLNIYNINTKSLKSIPTGYTKEFEYLNDSIMIAGIENKLKLINVNSGAVLKETSFEGRVVIDFLSYDQQANQIVLSFEDDLYLLHPSTLAIEKILTGHRNKITDVKFSENREKIFAISSINEVRIWDTKMGTPEGSLLLMGKDDWVVTGRHDLFDSSPTAMKQLYYVLNDSTDKIEPWKVIGIEQLKHRYYQPGLLQIQMGLSKEPLRTVPSLNLIELSPKLKGTILLDKLQIELKNQRGGIGKIAIFINGAEIISDARPNGNKDQDFPLLKFAIDLNAYKISYATEDEVEIKIVAWNKGGWLSSAPEIIKYNLLKSKGVTVSNNAPKKEIEKPRLFALVFGTADYSGTQIDLRYAGKDAADFASALQNSAQKLFGVNEVEVNLFNSESTDPARQPEKKNLVNAMTGLAKKMKPTDILVVYLSGHGVNFGGAEGDFYYLTKEAAGADAIYLADPAVRNSTAVSSAELTNLLNKITAKKKMLILDACASGKAAETMLVAARDVPASQVRALDRMQDRTGFYILSGSASDAVSYESSVYGQGLLTYSLLKAMKGAALRIDADEEYVDIQKLLQYAVDEVPKLAAGIGGIQRPLYRSPDSQQSFDIGKIDETTKKSIVLAEPKPVFVAVGLQDPIELFDKLNLSEKINAAIRENTAKGKHADFVFTEAKDYPGAYRISGTYEQKDDTLSLKYVLIKDKVRIGEVRTFTANFKDAATFANSFMDELKANVK